MDTVAQVKNKEGVKEQHGLNYLDLLKHASKTVILSLQENDRFGLVSYSSAARTEYELDYMTEENKKIAVEKLEALFTEGCTNIWDGLKTALNQL